MGLPFFVSFRNFFSDNTRVRIFIFFVALSAKFFFENLTLGYMTITLNQIIFFFLHQNQNIFFSHIGNQNISLEKKPRSRFELTTSVVIGTGCIGSCKSNYHTIMVTTALVFYDIIYISLVCSLFMKETIEL